MLNRVLFATTVVLFFPLVLSTATSQEAPAEAAWQNKSIEQLAEEAAAYGSAARGAMLFYRSAAACAQCHAEDQAAPPLGPALSELGDSATRPLIVESILKPSQKIEAPYRTAQVLTVDGRVLTGIVRAADPQHVVLSSAGNVGEQIQLERDEIESLTYTRQSLMPTGLATALGSSQAFFDVVEYVYAVGRGGKAAVAKLRPDAAQLQLADDTENLDHAGILQGLGPEDLAAGERIYRGHCVNCHGKDGNQPTLVTARAFGREPMKFGADPYAMLRTLTMGNGLMGPMRHLSPKERYQVIHFIRQRFMRDANPGYQAITADYLAGLPKGSEDGTRQLTGDRDYGPVLASQLGQAVQSGLTFRLADDLTYHFDLHRFRSAGSWTDGFLDLSETQHYRQRGERMPQSTGVPLSGFDAYAWQLAEGFEIPDEAKPPRGPVDDELAEYYGHYLHGDQAILHYRIAGREVFEAVDGTWVAQAPVVRHTLHVGPGDQAVRLRVLAPTRDGQTKRLDGVPFEGSAAAEHVVLLPAARADEKAGSQYANRPLHVVGGKQARQLDLGTPGRTTVVRFRAGEGGTLIASAPPAGRWQPNGKSLFIRGGRLVFDIGWVGAMTSRNAVDDGRWHTAAVVVTDAETKLFVDGKLQATRAGFRRPPEDQHVLKVGATADNFGGDLKGEVAWAAIVDQPLTPDQLSRWQDPPANTTADALWSWDAAEVEAAPPEAGEPELAPLWASAVVAGDIQGLRWEEGDEGALVLRIPPAETTRVIELSRMSLPEDQAARMASYVKLRRSTPPNDPRQRTSGGPQRWPERLTVSGTTGESINGYALDTIPVPFENPWNAWMRTSAVDFFADGRAVVTTHGGDVYLVDGIDETLAEVTWKRFAAGLFEPFGVRVVDETIYVTCRDGIKRLHDLNGDDEVDFVEAFWIDDDVSCMFHAYNFDLQTDAEGNFYFAKAGQYTRHHRPGTIMKVPPEGGSAEVVAFGLRTPNGMGRLPGDRFTVSDNQGPWMPAGKISLIRKDAFLGNMPINDAQEDWLRERYDGQLPETFDEPFIWMPQEVDNSCGGQVWADDPRFGPLAGRLLHSSFGKGWLYHLSLQEIDGQLQGAIMPLPHQWDAGVMRLRVNPHDGQVYGTGLSGWQGPAAGRDGCLQRLRYTDEPARIIERVRVVPGGVELTFNYRVPEAAKDPATWDIQMWDYLWSRRYGSEQFSVRKPGTKGRDELRVRNVEIDDRGHQVTLHLDQLAVCDQLKIRFDWPRPDSRPFTQEVHMTIHNLAKQP